MVTPISSGPLFKAGALFEGYRITKPLTADNHSHCGAIQCFKAIRAAELRLDAVRTIYCMRPALPEGASEVVADFEKGVARLKALRLPELPEVEAGGFAEGILWVAVQDVRGDTLKNLIINRDPNDPFPLPMCIRLVAAIARVFQAASEQGISHYGLTAYDVICSPDLELRRITGMGILQLFGRTARLPGTPSDILSMAPEQILKDAVVGPKTDVYSVGLLFYELCTLDLPFTNAHGKTPEGEFLLNAIRSSALEPLSSKLGCPELIDRFMRRLVANDADRRAGWQIVIDEAEATAKRVEHLLRPTTLQPTQGEETDQDGGNEEGSAPISRAGPRTPIAATIPAFTEASAQPLTASSFSTMPTTSTAPKGEVRQGQERTGNSASIALGRRALLCAYALGAVSGILGALVLSPTVAPALVATPSLRTVRPPVFLLEREPTSDHHTPRDPSPLFVVRTQDNPILKRNVLPGEHTDPCLDWGDCDPP